MPKGQEGENPKQTSNGWKKHTHWKLKIEQYEPHLKPEVYLDVLEG
jgi:hypothetical protein